MSIILKKLECAFDEIAVCHCGALLEDHCVFDNHSPSWNPCLDSKMLAEAIEYIKMLETQLTLWDACHTEIQEIRKAVRERTQKEQNGPSSPNPTQTPQ
jgi:hypothetical protein